MSSKRDDVFEKFEKRYGEPECIVKSPGRANIIGEHIDYCGGLVLPFATEQSMYFCLNTNTSNDISIYSVDYDETYTISEGVLDNDKTWYKYFNGLINVLASRDLDVAGINIAFGSDIPIGGGVSSSSALCCGLILLLKEKFGLKITPQESIEMAATVEHGFGLKGGKMDQTAILLGRENKAILLDCASTKYTYVDLDIGDHFFMLFDTNVKHSLIDTDYNTRRNEVEFALELVRQKYGLEKTFRNTLEEQLAFLRPAHLVNYKRMHHVIAEIERVEKAIVAIQNKDMNTLGQLINDSHASLAGDYEVSCKELNFLVENLQSYGEVVGARMMGGGFGGNVIALMSSDLPAKKLEKLKMAYKTKYGFDFRTMKIKPSDGARYLKEIKDKP